MNEYVIAFINADGTYQELTFRGVAEPVAAAMASGLLAAGFSNVSLTVREMVNREVSVMPG